MTSPLLSLAWLYAYLRTYPGPPRIISARPFDDSMLYPPSVAETMARWEKDRRDWERGRVSMKPHGRLSWTELVMKHMKPGDERMYGLRPCVLRRIEG